MTWAPGKWHGPSGEVSLLGTLSYKGPRQIKFSPTELTEKAHMVHATWKTILNPSSLQHAKTPSGEQLL